ncbi:MAG: hypothetical protein QXL57_09085 [Candidatus Bathyarchaeia archaeon]
MQYKPKHLRLQTAVFRKLVKEGPKTTKQLINELKVSSKDERAFYRGIKELKDIGVVTQNEKTQALYAYGHEPTEIVKLNVGSQNVNLTIPVNREQVPKIIKKCPSLTRNREASAVLKETNLLKKPQ